MVLIRLGNAGPLRPVLDPKTGEVAERVLVEFDEPQVTEIGLHEDDLLAALATVKALWADHSDRPPVWVSADDEAIEAMLARHFGCERGEPAPKARKGAK